MDKILIVDDEYDICEVLEFNLMSEYEVTTANSAEEALDLDIASFDLLLLDVMMEGKSGFKLANIIKNKKQLNIPIIFITAKITENDKLTGFELGADDYILKPFSIKEVQARVKAVLKRYNKKTKKSDRLVVVNELEINLDKKMVTIKGDKITLTKKEFEILSLLLTQPTVLFTRDDILKYVWQDEAFVSSRTVDVHIARLRKKIGEYSKFIVNRTGYGYYFENV